MESYRLDRNFLLLMVGVVATFGVAFAVGRATHETKAASGTEQAQRALTLPADDRVPAGLRSAPEIASITPPPPPRKTTPTRGFKTVTTEVIGSTVEASVAPAQSSPTPTIKPAEPPASSGEATVTPSTPGGQSSGEKPPPPRSPSSSSGGHGSFDSSG